MRRLSTYICIAGLLLLTACPKQVSHEKSSSSSNRNSYTGDWELIEVFCNDFPVQYSGFVEQLKLNQENQEATFTVSNSICETKVEFNVTQRNNRLTLRSNNFQCSPDPCSINTTFRLLKKIKKNLSCPEDMPSSITVDAELYNDYESLRATVPIPNSRLECELIFSKTE